MTSEEKQSPFRGPTFTLSAGFLAVVALLPVGILIRDSGTQQAEPRGSATSRPQQPSAGNSNGSTPTCRPTDARRLVPRKAPAGVAWQIYKTVALPYSRTAGPLVLEGEIARCYAPTPAGALIAAAQISTRSAFSDEWRAVTERQVVPGPGRDAFIKEFGRTRPGNSIKPGSLGQIAGFKFISYSQHAAEIELVMRFFTGRMSANALTVKWSGSDWQLEFSSNGSTDAQGRTIPSLDGYILWGGV
ncbi:hypothetical protein GCM10010191_44780 [Actinomadura vinacea]|uniref:DUF8175 domain-containing protein n=1 Tax=Actinomadura vinacea TaxID=115336 RepID=A0ABN3JDJ3_9ACTN